MSQLNSNPAVHALTAASGTGSGVTLDNVGVRLYHNLFVVAGAGVTAGVVAVELSNDGANWFAPASNTVSTTSATTFSVTVGPLPFQFVRARISTGITGGTVDAYIASA